MVFCAAPVAALPALVAEAVEASGADAVVTDVGSTKRAADRERSGEGAPSERFIGGHPLAGAETSGVENARADLFEGARWYLTPDRALRGPALRPAAARRSPTSAPARRRSTPRPTTA